MVCHDIRELLQRLTALGELHEIRAEVSPLLEIAAVTDRVSKGGAQLNRALLFNAVTGSPYRVATNLFGSERRVAAALGERFGALFQELLAQADGSGALAKLAALPLTPAWLAAAPLMAAAPPAELAATTLSSLPLIKNHPYDGEPDHDGRFITLPLVITTDPDLQDCNCGMYRAAVSGDNRLVISWGEQSGAAAHEAAWQAAGRPMPVVIAVGGPPMLTFAATLPLPLDEFTLAGALQGEPLQLFRCGNGLPAPAAAEVVIEGYLLPDKAGSGAFGNHTGGYTPSLPAAAMGITAISCRRDMVLPSTVVGRPPMEDCWLARAAGRLALPLLRLDLPEVVALHQPLAGIFHGAAIIAVRGADGHGAAMIGTIRQNPWFARAKLLVLVDACQDPADESGVLWRIMNCVNAERDIVISAGSVSIDATGKANGNRAVEPDAAVAALIEKRWKEYGFAG
ncbi:MAG: UbiD family decarboxylase [Geobacter sp.]|nr:UbiD family decarboxylase [Geobacter sp.]